jgi:hypothetical protein
LLGFLKGVLGKAGRRGGFFLAQVWWNAWQGWTADGQFLEGENFADSPALFSGAGMLAIDAPV